MKNKIPYRRQEITKNDNNLYDYLNYNEEEQYKLPSAFTEKHSLNETKNLSKEIYSLISAK